MSDFQLTVLIVGVVIFLFPFLTFFVVKFGTIAFYRGKQRFYQVFDNEKEDDNGK